MTTNPNDKKAVPRPAPGDDDDAAADTPQIRALRIAVIVMSLLLVAGFITVIARIIYLASRSNAPSAAAQGLPGAGPVSLKGEVSVPLPAGAAIGSSQLDGGRLTLTYTAPSGPGIVIVDMETGKVLSRVRVTPETGR